MTTMSDQDKNLTNSTPTSSLKGVDEEGKPIPLREQFFKNEDSAQIMTQMLFLETKYGTEFAIYTTKDYDHEYDGKLYPSLKKIYLEMEDATEYDFANKYFDGWDHWQRVVNNGLFTKMVQKWREELDLKIQAQVFKEMKKASKGGSMQATKWLADREWDKRRPGRPSKSDVDSELKKQADIANEYGDDAERLGIK